MKRITDFIFAVVILSLALLTGCGSDPSITDDELLPGLTEMIEKQMKEWYIPGCAVGVIKDDRVIFMKAFGYRDIEKELPVTTKTIFPVASCTKSFTALTAFMSIEDSLIKLDQPVKEYLPGFQMHDENATERATLRHFLAHRSGLGPNSIMPYLTGCSGEDVFDRLCYFEPSGEIGKRLEYSNLGYAMAGLIVGKVNGIRWEDYVRQSIFKPIGISDGCFTKDEIRNSGDFAQGYVNFFDVQPVPIEDRRMIAYAPAGGIAINIEDMLKWLRFNLNEGRAGRKQLVTPEDHRAMYESVTKLSWPDDSLWTKQSIAYGWMNELYRGHKSIYHGGLGDGFISRVSFLPEEKMGVVVLTNLYYQHFEQVITYEIYDMLLGVPVSNHHERNIELVSGAEKSFRDYYNSFWNNIPDSLKGLPAELVVGQYSNPLFGQVTIYEDGGNLSVSFDSGLTVPLRPYSEDSFATECFNPEYSHKIFSFNFQDNSLAESFSVVLEEGVPSYLFMRINEN